MRDAGNGYILAQPAGIRRRSSWSRQDFEDRVIVGQLVRNEPMKQALAHMRALAEVGAPGDLDLAWQTWQPLANRRRSTRSTLSRADYEQLAKEAGRRHEVLVARAEMEAAAGEGCRRMPSQSPAGRGPAGGGAPAIPGTAEAEVARAKALLASAEATLKEAA